MKKWNVMLVVFTKYGPTPISYSHAFESSQALLAAEQASKMGMHAVDSEEYDETGVLEFRGHYKDSINGEVFPCRAFVRDYAWVKTPSTEPEMGEDGIGVLVRKMYTPDEISELYDRGISRDEVRRSARLGRRID